MTALKIGMAVVGGVGAVGLGIKQVISAVYTPWLRNKLACEREIKEYEDDFDVMFPDSPFNPRRQLNLAAFCGGEDSVFKNLLIKLSEFECGPFGYILAGTIAVQLVYMFIKKKAHDSELLKVEENCREREKIFDLEIAEKTDLLAEERQKVSMVNSQLTTSEEKIWALERKIVEKEDFLQEQTVQISHLKNASVIEKASAKAQMNQNAIQIQKLEEEIAEKNNLQCKQIEQLNLMKKAVAIAKTSAQTRLNQKTVQIQKLEKLIAEKDKCLAEGQEKLHQIEKALVEKTNLCIASKLKDNKSIETLEKALQEERVSNSAIKKHYETQAADLSVQVSALMKELSEANTRISCLEDQLSSQTANQTQPKIIADEMIRLADEYSMDEEYVIAIKLYTRTLQVCHSPNALKNRALCYYELGHYSLALDDARKVIEERPDCEMTCLLASKCHIALGNPDEALMIIEKLQQSKGKANKIHQQIANNARKLKGCQTDASYFLGEGNLKQAIYAFKEAMTIAVSSASLVGDYAQCLALDNRTEKAVAVIRRFLELKPDNADTIYLRGYACFLSGCLHEALSHFESALEMSPGHKKGLHFYRILNKELGNDEALKQNYENALNYYEKAFAIGSVTTEIDGDLYHCIALALFSLGKFPEACKASSKVIEMASNDLSGSYFLRAYCNIVLDQFDQAVDDYGKLVAIDAYNYTSYFEAAVRIRDLSKVPNYYSVLEVTPESSNSEIKKKYFKLSMKHHPDKCYYDNEESRLRSKVYFQEFNDAYATLTDQEKRAEYMAGFATLEQLLQDVLTQGLQQIQWP